MGVTGGRGLGIKEEKGGGLTTALVGLGERYKETLP